MAELAYQPISIPLVHGIATDTNRRMRAPERLEVARNCQAAEIGGLRKRYGFTAISALISGSSDTISVNGPVRAIAATTRELLAAGHRNLYGYVPELDRWISRGAIAPCGIGVDPWFVGGPTYSDGDCAIGLSGNVVIYCAVRAAVDRGAVNSSYSIEVRGATADDVGVLESKHLETTSSSAARPYHVRCCGNGTTNVEILVAEAAGDPEELEWYRWSSSTPTGTPALVSQLTTDLRTGTGQHDCIEISGGFIFAWVDSSGVIQLRRYNTAGTQQATATINPPDGSEHDLVALADSETADQFYVLTTVQATVGDPGVDGDILLYCRTRSSATLVGLWGPITMGTLTGGLVVEVAFGLGVAQGDTNDQGNDRVACVWGEKGTAGERSMHSRSTNTGGGVLDTEHTLYNAIPLVRPHWYRNRCYVGIQSMFVSAPNGTDSTYPAGFCTAFFGDIHCDEATRLVRYSSIFHVGQARGLKNESAGNLPHVVNLSSTNRRSVVPRIGEAIVVPPDGSALGFYSEMGALDKVTLRYDEEPLVAALPRGAAVIGGGYVGWYDGMRTFEMGFISPPWIALVDGAGATTGAGPIAGTYQYSNLWEERDAAGYTHLSVPSPTVQIVNAVTDDVRLDAHSLPGTWRPASSVRWFRSSSNVDTVLRRSSRASEMLVNLATEFVSREVDNLADSDVVVPIYTTGGALASVCPSGARIPLLSRESLWLADQANGSAVSYSPLVTPSTPQDDLRAPTMFEALSRIVDDGRRVMGLGSLDGATVVLSTDGVYLLSGYGPDRLGRGDDVSRMTAIPTDAGCIEPRSVVSWPNGVAWQSTRGLTALSRGQGVDPTFGEPVRDLLDSYPVVTSAVVVEKRRHIRWTVQNAAATDGRVLVYDYRAGEWYEWIVKSSNDTTVIPQGGAVVDGVYYLLSTLGVTYFEDESTNKDNATVYVPMVLETGEIQPAGIGNLQQVADVVFSLERADSCGIKVYVAYDYAATPATAAVDFTDALLDALREPSTRMQLQHKPTQPRHRSMRIRIEDYSDGSPTTGAGYVARAITAQVAVVQGGPRVEAEARA